MKPVIDPVYGSSDIRMPFVRKIDHPGEMKDTNVRASCLKTVPHELEGLLKKTYHYEIKEVPNMLLDQLEIGLDFNLPVIDLSYQKGIPYFHLRAGKDLKSIHFESLYCSYRSDSLGECIDPQNCTAQERICFHEPKTDDRVESGDYRIFQSQKNHEN